MQFRPPFRPSSDRTWQPQAGPPQHHLPPQLEQQHVLPHYQPPPSLQPPSPPKKNSKRLWFAITAVVIVAILVTALVSTISNASSNGHQHTNTVATRADQASSRSNPAVTATNLSSVKPTYGSPSLYGHISDFIGKYGKPSTSNGKDSLWLLKADGSHSLEVREIGGGVVGYVSVSIADSWSAQMAQAYCLTFAPRHYTPEKASMSTNSGESYVYDSPSGKFALHVSPGNPAYCFLKSVSNP